MLQQNKEADRPPTHARTCTVVRTKAKSLDKRVLCGRPYRRGCVYNLRFMSTMLTGRGGGVGVGGERATVTRAVHRLMRLTNTYAHTHTHRQTHTHIHSGAERQTVKHAAELAQCVKCHICVALINSLKCFNAPAGTIKCSGIGVGKQQIYRQPSSLPIRSTRLGQPSRISFT